MSEEQLFVSLYVDADLTPLIVSALRQRNYECQSALENGMRAETDEKVLERATELGMVLLTHNACDLALWRRNGPKNGGRMPGS